MGKECARVRSVANRWTTSRARGAAVPHITVEVGRQTRHDSLPFQQRPLHSAVVDSDEDAAPRSPVRLHGCPEAQRTHRDLVAGLGAGRGAAVVVMGEPGSERFALLAAARSAAGCTVHHVEGVGSETAVSGA